MNKKVTGRSQGALQDAAEKWLSDNDPDYAEQKRKWQTPTTDALVRDRRPHSSMEELTEIDPAAHDGNYRKYPKSGHFVGHKLENENPYEEDFEDEGER